MTNERDLATRAVAGALDAMETIEDTTLAVDAAVCIIAGILSTLEPVDRITSGKLLVTHAAQLLEHMER